MTETPKDSTETPVGIKPGPETAQGRRVLGMVPGKPNAGDRKVPEDEEMVMVWPHLLVRHGVAVLGTMFTVLVIATLFDAPLRAVANPTVTPNPEKAPWYFAALQELLAHYHPMIAGVLVPGAIILGLAALPYVDRSLFIKPKHRRVAVTAFTVFMLIFIALTLVGFMFRGPNWGWVWPWEEWHGEL